MNEEKGLGLEQPVKLTPSIEVNLNTSAQWMKVVAIIQIVILSIGSLFLIFGIFGVMINISRINLMTLFILLIEVGILVLAFILAVSLLRSATAFQNFITQKVPNQLEIGFENMKKYWKTAGILTIISIVFSIIYVIFIVIVLNSYGRSFRF